MMVRRICLVTNMHGSLEMNVTKRAICDVVSHRRNANTHGPDELLCLKKNRRTLVKVFGKEHPT